MKKVNYDTKNNNLKKTCNNRLMSHLIMIIIIIVLVMSEQLRGPLIHQRTDFFKRTKSGIRHCCPASDEGDSAVTASAGRTGMT